MKSITNILSNENHVNEESTSSNRRVITGAISHQSLDPLQKGHIPLLKHTINPKLCPDVLRANCRVNKTSSSDTYTIAQAISTNIRIDPAIQFKDIFVLVSFASLNNVFEIVNISNKGALRLKLVGMDIVQGHVTSWEDFFIRGYCSQAGHEEWQAVPDSQLID